MLTYSRQSDLHEVPSTTLTILLTFFKFPHFLAPVRPEQTTTRSKMITDTHKILFFLENKGLCHLSTFTHQRLLIDGQCGMGRDGHFLNFFSS